MGGVFMFKLVKRLVILGLLGAAFFAGSVYADKQVMQDRILRLHVVADSNSDEDQSIKEKVRDALLAELEPLLEQVDSKEKAQALLQSKLEQLEHVANQTLQACGVSDLAKITLDRESFDTRVYDTFTLPAGIYDSLRVVIGSGQGKNWWCVVFPSLCMPAAEAPVEDVAAGAGFSESLSGAITGKQEYRVRFFFLDCMGKLENFFWKH